MFDNYLIASKYGFNGVYRAKLLTAVDDSDIRVYVPGINSINPLDSNGNVDMTVYEKNKLSYPVVQWCCYNLESKELVNIEGPAWVMFENGDVQRPVCISYAVIGGENDSSSSGSNTSSGSNGTFTTVAGEGVILIQGPLNDSRSSSYTKETDISTVPQVITYEFSLSGAQNCIQNYSSMDVDQQEICSYIINNGGTTNKQISELGRTVTCFGNAILCATTKKFGNYGDYIWFHFTDNAELLFLKVDQKSEGKIYGNADPANEWGHWADFSGSRPNVDFSVAKTISIIEVFGMSGGNISSKTCDYAVNLGSAINNKDLAFKSLSDIKSLVASKISIVNGGSNTIIEKAISAWYADCNGKSYGRGTNQYDCSSSTSHAFYKAGILSTDTYTTETAIGPYTKAGFIDVTFTVGTSSYSNLKRGDVLWSKGHMCIYLGDGKITTSNTADGNSIGNWYDFATKVLRYGG